MDPEAFQHALGLHQRGQLAQAEQLYRGILASEPGHFAAAHSLGLIFLQRGQADLAERQLSRAIELDPNIAEAHGNRGNALKALHRLEEALVSYDRALALKPDFADALVNRGSVLQDLRRFDQALDSYDRALALRPQSPVALGNRAWVLHNLDRPDEALIGYDQVLALRPDDRHALVNRGLVLHDLRRYEAAVASYDTAIAVQADAPRVFFCRANALAELLRSDEALASFDQAIALQPDFADARRNRGILKLLTGNFAGGWVDYEHRRPKEQARLPGVRLISLQKRFGLDELEGLPGPMRVETLGADFDEGNDAFVDSAAVMEQLDLVISSDTSLAHLAGALGRPAWVALKQVPEWRWLLDRDDSPWYPSLRLFRQSRRDQWSDVFDAMALELAKTVPSP